METSFKVTKNQEHLHSRSVVAAAHKREGQGGQAQQMIGVSFKTKRQFHISALYCAKTIFKKVHFRSFAKTVDSTIILTTK